MKTVKRVLAGLAMGFILAVLVWTSGRAGGWAAVVLDELPAGITAGEPLETSFRVLQHGHRPVSGETPVVRAENAAGEALEVEAAAGKGEGRYIASLMFPAAGTWRWSIEAFGGEHAMPDLMVGEAPVVPAGPRIAFGMAGIGLAALIGAAFFGWKGRRPWAAALLFVALLAGGGFVYGARPAAAEASPAEIERTPAEIGRDLFLAKGCITCHWHKDFSSYEFWSTNFGPNLSSVDRDAAFLRVWLDDPTIFNPGALEDSSMNTGMPDLDLSEAEIEALIAFLKDD